MRRQIMCRRLAIADVAEAMYGERTPAAVRRATRYLRRRERETGTLILLGGGRLPLSTTIAMLRKGAPEIVDDTSQTVGIVDEYLGELREDVRTTMVYARALGKRLRETRAEVAELSTGSNR